MSTDAIGVKLAGSTNRMTRRHLGKATLSGGLAIGFAAAGFPALAREAGCDRFSRAPATKLEKLIAEHAAEHADMADLPKAADDDVFLAGLEREMVRKLG
jgi:hypothetical protein